MGRYLSPAPRVKKQQVFTVSGTFTPSPGLLAAGGMVEVRCVGGGGGCFLDTGSGGGGSGADITRIVKVTGPVAVIIGAAGQSGRNVLKTSGGGTTKFGALVVAPGGDIGGWGNGGMVGHNGPISYAGLAGLAGGEGGINGCPGVHHRTITWNGEAKGTASFESGAGGGAGPGCGAGFFAFGTGVSISDKHRSAASGLCIVTWEE